MDVMFDGAITKVTGKRSKDPNAEPMVIIQIETTAHGEKIAAILEFLKRDCQIALVDPQLSFRQTFGKAFEDTDTQQ